MLESRPDRNRLLSQLRRHHDLRARMVSENVRAQVRKALRAFLRSHPNLTELYPYIVNERQLEETLTRPAVRRRVQKILRKADARAAEEAIALLRWGAETAKRGRKRWFGRLTRMELTDQLTDAIGRYGVIQGLIDDFSLVRSHYGRIAGQAIPWQGLRLWRTQEVKISTTLRAGVERIELLDLQDKRQEEIENQFLDGNLFYLRAAGEIYPTNSRRGERVIFMFADLRNSTETTMRLTKDTASFLTPYLTAVNQIALNYQGERIYFAGDGYSAYYRQAQSSIRAAYMISGQFAKLRRQASEEHLREAREIYQAALETGVNLQDTEKIRGLLKHLKPGEAPGKVQDFLTELAQIETRVLEEDDIKKALSKVAATRAMPRVDIGIAITAGELFFALIGQDQQDQGEKIKIVISPQLSQAARLSGSSEEVRNYIETHYPQPFPYNVHAWEKKLFNRGIVITEGVFETIKKETSIQAFNAKEEVFKQEKLFNYIDKILQRRIIIREIHEAVMLKGISEPCRIFEVSTSGSALDKNYGGL
ncbi:MAG: hypothetical protein AB1439_09205 [candidate division FCPU426 bacterium]